MPGWEAIRRDRRFVWDKILTISVFSLPRRKDKNIEAKSSKCSMIISMNMSWEWFRRKKEITTIIRVPVNFDSLISLFIFEKARIWKPQINHQISTTWLMQLCLVWSTSLSQSPAERNGITLSKCSEFALRQGSEIGLRCRIRFSHVLGWPTVPRIGQWKMGRVWISSLWRSTIIKITEAS